ncbi:MAG TPA: ATP-binding protein [Acidimicrobiales bacterium]|jgi:anti-sigma regulatory factor (Ser/Thr protein kinase)|nr:ATP-binding protein [Acidimicrobiales bacterium]
MAVEKVRLKIGNMAKAVLVTGQAYQDPKDALNEFVSNAADEYAEAERRGEVIRVVLRRKGRYPTIAIDDSGRGMTVDKLRSVARNLFESEKAGDLRTLGEKAIGTLAFQQLGGRLDIVTRPEGSDVSHSLRLERGKAIAQLEENERRRPRATPGTTVYISELDPDVLRVLTMRKVVDYLRRRRGPALARGDYVIEVQEGKTVETVTPDRPDGIRVALPAQATLWGRIEFALYVAPQSAASGSSRRVAVVGRAGTVIIDDLVELDEFEDGPWSTGQVSGEITFEGLQQSAGRRAILRDRDAFPAFVLAVRSVEPTVVAALEKVRKEVDQQTADRVSDAVRRIFGRVLKELDDLDNPMRSAVGHERGHGGLFAPAPGEGGGPDDPVPPRPADERSGGSAEPPEPPGDDAPNLDDLAPTPIPDEQPAPAPARPQRPGGSRLPTVAVDPEPGDARSRFDPDEGVVYYSDRHPDYLLVKDEESSLLDYLATLVAKEYVVYNNPRATSAEFAEEMVRMLVRVRRHLRRR